MPELIIFYDAAQHAMKFKEFITEIILAHVK